MGMEEISLSGSDGHSFAAVGISVPALRKKREGRATHGVAQQNQKAGPPALSGVECHASTRCRRQRKKPQPLNRTPGGQEPHPHRARITTLPGHESAAESGPESAANQTRIHGPVGVGVGRAGVG